MGERRKKILVVDDDDDLLYMMKVSLSRYDYELVGADRASEGADKITETAIDLVIVDIGLPNVDGNSFIKWVRETDAKVPIIAISGSIERKEEALQAGANCFFAKPFERSFFDEVSKMVESKGK